MSEMIKILFVDDEQEVLDGLRRMTRTQRSIWDARFAIGGEQALSMIDRDQYDVVVTDMRMPGMDGAELLRRTVESHPYLIRVVLSGQYDVDAFVKSGWPAHQFLSKPCEPDELIQAVNHAFNMRGLLDNSVIRDIVTRANSLPSLPGLYMQIENELLSANASMKRVGDIISGDVGISAKVLQMVNSPVFGCTRKIDSVGQAVVMLGADIIKALVLYLQACSSIRLPADISLQRVSEHGVRIGALSKAVAEIEGQDKETCVEAFLAGLLQNIGSLIIISSFPDEYSQIEQQSDQQGVSVSEVERSVLGTTHAEIGAYLISLWGLSSTVAKAIAYHDDPSKCGDEAIPFALVAVHVANALDKDTYLGAAFVENDFDFEFLESCGLLTHLPIWQKKYQELLQGGEHG